MCTIDCTRMYNTLYIRVWQGAPDDGAYTCIRRCRTGLRGKERRERRGGEKKRKERKRERRGKRKKGKGKERERKGGGERREGQERKRKGKKEGKEGKEKERKEGEKERRGRDFRFVPFPSLVPHYSKKCMNAMFPAEETAFLTFPVAGL